MRIISQDKRKDVLYEHVTLYIQPYTCNIYASFGVPEEDFLIGAYITEERCKEIMQEIRDVATGVVKFYGENYYFMPEE